jgi:hypothetical protein
MARKKPKAPPAPDVSKMIGASSRANVNTAMANTRMAQVNEVGPGGSSTYSQTGTYDYVDPETGAVSKMPTFTRTTTLTPGDQRIQDINTQTRTGLSEIGRDQTSFLQNYLANNRAGVQPDEAVRTRYEDALMERMRPRQEQDRAALEARLANQGIGIGSRAYSAADRDFSTGVNDARLAAIGAAGDEQARDFSVRSAARAAPINEVMALLNGAQVQMPNFGAPSRGAPIANTDVAGLMQQGYNNELGQYGMKMDQYNQRMGGLFGLGASLISGLPLNFGGR